MGYSKQDMPQMRSVCCGEVMRGRMIGEPVSCFLRQTTMNGGRRNLHDAFKCNGSAYVAYDIGGGGRGSRNDG